MTQVQPPTPQSPSEAQRIALNQSVSLKEYALPTNYSPGAALWKQLLWYYLGFPLVKSRLMPFSSLKIWLLKAFGATVGTGVRIKPGVRIKFPWKLTIGDHCWLGESAWIDNVGPITIGDNVCLSQGVYLCTGNHDWSLPTFDLRLGEIHIQSGSWLGAKSVVGPSVTVGEGAILTLGSVATRSLQPMTIYAGNPAQAVKERVLTDPGVLI
ncbi:MAG: WcaF family extracellular polysaccharide biosynthesis acetyltransferase [Cyanobacteria bacterium P01_F01_bin.150]